MKIEYRTIGNRTIYICCQNGTDFWSVTMLANGLALLNGVLNTEAAKQMLSAYIAAGTPLIKAA